MSALGERERSVRHRMGGEKVGDGPVTLTPGSPRGPGSRRSREVMLDDVMFVPGSSDIADRRTGELG
jgi:hypothetical protein